MYLKKLVGTKCYLSPIEVEDYEKYAQWVTDMDVSVGMMFSSRLITSAKEKEILGKLSKAVYLEIM